MLTARTPKNGVHVSTKVDRTTHSLLERFASYNGTSQAKFVSEAITEAIWSQASMICKETMVAEGIAPKRAIH